MYKHKWPAANPVAAVVLVHGTGEHHGRYAHVARYLNERGWDVYTGDLPGYGQSPGKRGHIDSFSQYIETVHQWTKEAVEQSDGRPVYLMGHSLGGLIVTRYVQTQATASKLSGIILTSPCLELVLKVPEWKKRLAKVLDRIWPSLALSNGISPDMVSRDAEVQDLYKRDPLNCHKVSVRWFEELHRAMGQAWEEANKLDFPILILQAGDDLLVDARAVERFADRIQAEKEFHLFPHLRHEVLNEPEKEQVLERIVQWMEKNGSDA
ncbi:alpha/beta hydrolase [Brevibacillus panacihumi]|uniref:Lysophospholipase n=1 Tax=Brevibacillus panacihumi TaxID=497735 RepID=A0A3M8CYF7_9BACL|nr:alpha/beta hydrolase [Brevibacillus panacihumi]RNB80866.1 lysophospholipase [Brevibacillus panacihumi]